MGSDTIKPAAVVDEGSEEFKRFIKRLAEQQALTEAELPIDKTKEIWVPSKEPIAICFSSDWHLGSLGVDYARFEQDITFMLEHKEIKLITVGDLIDNFKTFKSLQPIFEQGLSPQMQARMLMKLARSLARNGQYIAATWGNHDNTRDETLFGESPIAAILSEHVPFFDGIGLVNLKVGPSAKTAENYTILMTHNARGSSRTDKNYSAKRLYVERFPADVVVTAHRHAPSISQDTYYEDARQMGLPFGGQRISIACGTYKTSDLLGRRYYPTEGQVGAPTLLFWPDEHRMEAFRSAESALTFLRGLECMRSHAQHGKNK